ncbi:putative phosphoribosylformylglycinamidine synthase, chloroplastic/mitochondrial [Vitis vinifera]|uniref:Putative phosphoribosylformylglycinamidine synthase, chloroplastic/mitochondrial n=1 Tax=Vitis vinifera TaxID=29760 RepID=A0A438FSA6_VITVI|nr:putative phosphoribosylformylglycinamidine synthase, chloroplastic/mitochondrial [Vitis vinifera]
MVCGLEKHCGDLTTTSLPIIATVQCHRRQPPRQCTMSRSGPRFSRMWKQVLAYTEDSYGQHILNFLKIGDGLNHSFSIEFRRNSKLVDQKNFLYIEYLFRQGKLTRKRRSVFFKLSKEVGGFAASAISEVVWRDEADIWYRDRCRSYASWEDPSFTYPSNLASPLQILIDASNGMSDYGNKFGEPLIQGYTRTFGMRFLSGEKREWLKPITFSAGIGQIDHIHLTKREPNIGILVVKIRGLAYRIRMGGRAASSMVSGQNDAELDFNVYNGANGLISTGHDISDGGLIVCVLEMALVGNCCIALDLTSHGNSLFETLFAEELGFVLKVSRTNLDSWKAEMTLLLPVRTRLHPLGNL